MIHAEGRVVAVDEAGASVWVEVAARAAACGSCASSSSCRTDMLGGVGQGAARRYRVHNVIGAKVGDRVSLAVADGAILYASWFSYLLPALLAIAGGAVGQRLGGDVPALAGTVLGLLIGFGHLGWRGRRQLPSGTELRIERPQTTVCHLPEQS